MTGYKKYSELIKFKYVSMYNKLKENISSLNSFLKSIVSNNDNNNVELEGVSEATFRYWIKKVNKYNEEDLYNLLTFNKTKLKCKLSKKQKQLEKLKNNVYYENLIYSENSNKNDNNNNLKRNNNINDNKKKRIRYSYVFKKRWVKLYNKEKQKHEISLTLFSSLICGIDGDVNIAKGSVNESTFRYWIKLYFCYI